MGEIPVTDAEITRACAEAMGYRERTDMTCGPSFIMVFSQADSDTFLYDPLHDDEQMVALVKKLFIEILVDGPAGRSEDWTWTARIGGYNELPISISHGHDLNRAVCVCVARLAKEAK